MKKHTKIALAAALLVATTMAFVLPKISSTKADDVQPMTNLGHTEKYTLIQTEERIYTVEPSGQLPQGMSGGSMILITPNSDTTSFSVSLTYSVLSITVPINKTTPNYQSAFGIFIPNDGGYYKAYIGQHVVIKTYRTDVYSYSQLMSSHYSFEYEYTKGDLFYRKVG